MILVTGAIVARPDTFEALLELCIDHSRRSRTEPGCLSHEVHIDGENPMRLVFIERWTSQAALEAHFAVPDSGQFVRAARDLAAERTTMEVYEVDLSKV
jgi:quinol monooxygenase YgiN